MTNHKNRSLRFPFPQQIIDPARFSDKEIVTNRTSHHPVNLFLHRQVKTPQTRLNMRHLDQQFSAQIVKDKDLMGAPYPDSLGSMAVFQLKSTGYKQELQSHHF